MTTPAAEVVARFVVDTRRDGPVEMVDVRGRVDSATAALLAAVLDAVVARRPARVEVDLSGAVLSDPDALTPLLQAGRRLADRHAALVLRYPD